MIPYDELPIEQERPMSKDPRVTAAINWVWAGLGGLAIMGILWCGNSINQLNLKLERLIVQNDSMSQIIRDHNDRIRDLEQAQRQQGRQGQGR